MKVEITLKDEDGDERLIISNCVNPEYIFLTHIHSDSTIQVSIEDIKLALRKICVK